MGPIESARPETAEIIGPSEGELMRPTYEGDAVPVHRIRAASTVGGIGLPTDPALGELRDRGIEQIVASLPLRHSSVRSERRQRVAKRTLDLVVAVLLAPIAILIVAAAAIAIAVTDRQSPFFVDRRIGRARKQFGCLKLRTLKSDPNLLSAYLADNVEEAERYSTSRKLANDPRKTRVGSLLRHLSLDELPQLWNVLRGEMSIVGPRPLSPKEFDDRGPHGDALTVVWPGMTGLWQVSGRSELSYDDRVALDDWYAQHWSLRLDLSIVLRTPRAVFGRRGAV